MLSFPAASLTAGTAYANAMSNSRDLEVAFDFMVEGYELGAQTEGARMNLANSAKGQHIHLIIDNDPYSAHYDAGFTKEIERWSSLCDSLSYQEAIMKV